MDPTNMTTITLDPATEQRIAECARRYGMSEADLIRSLIDDRLDDLDDVQMAVERLDNPLQPLTSAEARQSLGLDD
jgi:predicted DNA-binding protein